jgi:hypothetical protein
VEYYSAPKNNLSSHEKTWKKHIYYQVRETRMKRLYIMIHNYDIQEEANYGENKKVSGFQGEEKERRLSVATQDI